MTVLAILLIFGVFIDNTCWALLADQLESFGMAVRFGKLSTKGNTTNKIRSHHTVTHAFAVSLPLRATSVTTGPDHRCIITDWNAGADPTGCKEEARDGQTAVKRAR